MQTFNISYRSVPNEEMLLGVEKMRSRYINLVTNLSERNE